MKALRKVVLRVLICGIYATVSWAEILPTGGRELLPIPVMRSMQAYMLEKRFDGWLFTGQGKFDDLASEFLGLVGKTRHRWFIFYPGLATLKKPFLIYHPEDEKVFSGINFYPYPYHSRKEMIDRIKIDLNSFAKVICLNYSENLNVPELSRVDAGTLELLKNNGFGLLSSGSILSFFHTRWRVSDMETHQEAASRLDSILPLSVDYLRERLLKNKRVKDYELVKFVKKRLKKLGLEEIEEPTVALWEKTLLEKYTPTRKLSRLISRDDLLYLEVAARLRNDENSMFARLGWSLYAGEQVPDSLSKPWERIVDAAEEALGLLSDRIQHRETLRGYEVDQAARAKLGSIPDILPRPLGYNLNRDQHRFGVRLDNYLAHDDREIMPGMGFTLEPGIYTDTYALRTCTNLFIHGNRQVNLPAPLQRKIIAVLGSAEI
jgi:hypothetical protein